MSSVSFVERASSFICPWVESLDFVGLEPLQSLINFPRAPQELKSRIDAMSNIKCLKIASFLIPNEIIRFQNAPLTKIVLDKVAFSHDSFQSFSNLIGTCRTLLFVSFSCIESENQLLSDKSPLFDAIKSNPSIRKFSFTPCKHALNQNEMQGVLNLVRQTKTLRTFSLIANRFKGEQYSSLFEALSKNTSLRLFRVVSYYWHMDSQILLDTRPIHEFLATNRSLQFLDMAQRFEILEKLSKNDVEEIKQAVVEHSGLVKFHLGSLQLSKSALKGDIVHCSLINEALHLLKLGRLLTFSKRILGKQLAVELVEHILKQITLDSVWPDDLWKPIRRAVMNRKTVGKLYSETRHFDAFELSYLCCSVDQ